MLTKAGIDLRIETGSHICSEVNNRGNINMWYIIHPKK